MAESNTGNSASDAHEPGVLANLPRTRPQRSTPRRVAARDGRRAAGTSSRARSSAPREPKPTRTRPSATTRPPATARTATRRHQTAPLQGFESDSEATSGSVQPPGVVELLGSAAEVLGELTKAGVSRSERLLKDLASRLPLS